MGSVQYMPSGKCWISYLSPIIDCYNLQGDTMENISQNQQLLREITIKVNKLRNYTPKVGVFGNSGVGKSSLCNALFGKEVAKIADVEACTREPQEIFIGSKDGKGGIMLVDVPGVGEDPERHKEYIALYKSLAPNLDLVLWAIKSDDRNYASAIEAYSAVFGEKTWLCLTSLLN
jgi:predicted GTPase